MSQIELEKAKRAIDGGRVANTYLMVGKADSDVLGSSFELIKFIIKSPYSNLEIPEQQAALQKLKSLTNPDIHYFYPVNTTSEVKTKASSEDFIEKWREIGGDDYENYKLEYVADIDYNSLILYPSHYWHNAYIKEDWFVDEDRVTFTGFFELIK